MSKNWVNHNTRNLKIKKSHRLQEIHANIQLNIRTIMSNWTSNNHMFEVGYVFVN